MFSIVFLLSGGATAVRAQSALDGFDPNANGIVQVVVVQPDGKILIGGDFTIVQGISRNRIARLNPDGTLDTAFNPNANGNVNAIAVQADGKILVGGNFSGANSIGGQTRNFIARLDATTGLADSFDPNASAGVHAIAVQADGKILAGGGFTSIGGTNRNRMGRLDATTGQADSFNAAVGGFAVNTIVVQADGKILVGGTFGSIGGQTRSCIARLDATTGLADSFNPNATTSSVVIDIAVQADGKILAVGTFNSIGGQPRNFIARLDAASGAADSFNPAPNSTVRTIAVQAEGRILAGGDFSNIGGQTRNRIARLDATTGLAEAFDPNAATAGVYAIAVQADGKILAGGIFTTFSPNGGTTVTRNNIARLEKDGSLDQTLGNIIGGVNSYIVAIVKQPDGKTLIGGYFNTVLGVTRNNIARLNRDGTLDTAFDPNANDVVYAIALDSDGRIYVGGLFTMMGIRNIRGFTRLYAASGYSDFLFPAAVGEGSEVDTITVQADGKILVSGFFQTFFGQPRRHLARFDPVSNSVDSFNANFPGGHINSVAVQADGKIIVGGNFTGIGGQMRNHIARLDATTGSADSFNPVSSGEVFAIAVQTDGKIVVGGVFTNIGGQTLRGIARLDATTGAADSFNPNLNGGVGGIALQSDGKILVTGNFFGTNSIGGATRNYIARLDSATGLSDTFNPNANAFVETMAVQPDGKIWAEGYFTSIGGQTRSNRARLSNDTAALQNLTVTQNAIIWTLGGSSPQNTRVTFESSTDNVNYVFLGNGMASGSSWTLTGLNLPVGQNIYIRARGHYRSGRYNGSESITESVWNAFIAPPPPRLNIQRSGNTNVVLSWTTNFTGFTLEFKTNLNTNVWSVVTNVPTLSGTNNVVTNAIGGMARFYRLRQ